MNLSSTLERPLSPALRAASVRLSRQISAPPKRIFDAWLTPDEARTFLFADRIGDAVRSEVLACVGGGFRIVHHRNGEDVEYLGEYLQIDRPHRLVFSLFVEKYAQRDDRVIVELAPVAEHAPRLDPRAQLGGSGGKVTHPAGVVNSPGPTGGVVHRRSRMAPRRSRMASCRSCAHRRGTSTLALRRVIIRRHQ
jgi:uncharacterized protein YndB with AHSA1/START domain